MRRFEAKGYVPELLVAVGDNLMRLFPASLVTWTLLIPSALLMSGPVQLFPGARQAQEGCMPALLGIIVTGIHSIASLTVRVRSKDLEPTKWYVLHPLAIGLDRYEVVPLVLVLDHLGEDGRLKDQETELALSFNPRRINLFGEGTGAHLNSLLCEIDHSISECLGHLRQMLEINDSDGDVRDDAIYISACR